jgi:hypothetical protein
MPQCASQASRAPADAALVQRKIDDMFRRLAWVAANQKVKTNQVPRVDITGLSQGVHALHLVLISLP